MKTNSFQDPRLERAVLGRKRVRVHRVTGIPVHESIEYKIIQLKKELGHDSKKAVQYQVLIFGEWRNVSIEDYQECKHLNMNVRIC